MAVFAHFNRVLGQGEMAKFGFCYEVPKVWDNHRARIGRSADEALTRLAIIRNLRGDDLIDSFSIEDMCIGSAGYLEPGTFKFEGIKVRIRVPQQGAAYFFCYFPAEKRNGFIPLLELLVVPNFSTNWLRCVERRPITEWEALKRPTLAERLAQRRQVKRLTR